MSAERPWADASRPLAERVESLLGEMTLDEKLAQLGSVWVGAELGSGNVAPMQEAFADPAVLRAGQRARARPLHAPARAPRRSSRSRARARLAARQQDLVARTRLGVPAIAHDECLTGFTTFRATVFPTALAWAATFDPELVERMTRAIGESMRAVGVHQGLSPVLDVVRDYRWGRVEETLGEDPYLVGMIGDGLRPRARVAPASSRRSSTSPATRPRRRPATTRRSSIGPRELRDVHPAAVRDGAAGGRRALGDELLQRHRRACRSAADAGLLTGVLRDEWGFEGIVVSDYWAIAFLRDHAPGRRLAGEAAALALAAGIDVELPHTALLRRAAGGARAGRHGAGGARRPRRAARAAPEGRAGAARRRTGRPSRPPWPRARSTSTRPRTARSRASSPRRPWSCSTTTARCRSATTRAASRWSGPAPTTRSPSSAATRSPTTASWRATRTSGSASRSRRCSTALRAELPGATIVPRAGLPGPGARPVAASRRRPTRPAAADVCIAVVGDRAGPLRPRHLGRGLRRRGPLAARHPGRAARRAARDGHAARARGRVRAAVRARPLRRPAGRRRPGVLPRRGGRPGARRRPVRARRAVGQAARPDPAQRRRAAEHVPASRRSAATAAASAASTRPRCSPSATACSYTTFGYSDLTAQRRRDPRPTASSRSSCVVRNKGDRAGTEVVQLYLADPVAQVTRPVIELAGFARVPLEPGEADARHLHPARRPHVVHRRRPPAHRGARGDPRDDRRLERGHPRERGVPAHRRAARRRGTTGVLDRRRSASDDRRAGAVAHDQLRGDRGAHARVVDAADRVQQHVHAALRRSPRSPGGRS